MYMLRVHYPGRSGATESHRALSASAALDLIAELLSVHPECECITVYAGETHLFSVDRKGNRIPG